MHRFLGFLLALILIAACQSANHSPHTQGVSPSPAYSVFNTERYELHKPEGPSSAVLILFGGFPENASDIQREFKILALAQEKQLSVLFMNYSQKLWLTQVEKNALSDSLAQIFARHELPAEAIFMGGFSSGGNVSLLLGDHLMATESALKPKGLFVIDSPVDLLKLYRVSELNVARRSAPEMKQEAVWLLQYFQRQFGTPETHLETYESFSPFTAETQNVQNLSHLNGLKLRFYTEPDTLWWKQMRDNQPEDLNAYGLKKLAEALQETLPDAQIEYIATENRGYRANGDRHPHSWSIVDGEGLIEWILGQE